MDFNFSEEQRLLRDSLANFLGDAYGFAARREALGSETGWRPEIPFETTMLDLLDYWRRRLQ